MTARRRPMGRGAAALSLLLPACLVPQSIDKSSNAPHVPPRIVVQSIAPQLLAPYASLQHGQVDVGQGCHCSVSLAIPEVDDEDVLARLEVRWFIDYDAQSSATQSVYASSFIEGTFDSALVKRIGPSLTLAPGAFVTDGYHAVDVVIAESGGFDDFASALRNRAVKPGYQSTEHRFFVQVFTNNSVACPGTFPSVRTCP